ncbi:glutamate-1-semialdehyde 2,1-aminomutase [Rhodoligotrophos appendicifer]|uniref:aminotransferase class III-fold pyridoxal phosphate-dependent enzyme n=1 Tax=Rhodoligotrophos appendicifer TaxID=987056 RepID=UPI001185487E|nr:aminotransferase class III-fold pyridoxal phosphate-dependent enzyme [Rhodoligotrophos appendicifer]
MTNAKLVDTSLEREFRRRTPKSADFAERASLVLPGGNTRTTVFHPPYPLSFARGDGPWLWDLDGNRYFDLFYNGLSIIHGHNYAPIREAIAAKLLDGSALGSASIELVEFAETLQRRLPNAELLRFTNTGSEAGMIAVRVARAVTGRPLLLKAERAYHGSYPDLEAGLYGVGDMPGRSLVAPFNDLPAFETVMAEHGSRVAAIILEPIMFTGRVVPPEPGFLEGVQALARKHGSLFMIDDCLMFRLAVGGSAEKFSLDPDITILGKFVGGGTPVGVVAGRRSVMESLDPTKPGAIFHGGSFNGNRIGATAGHIAMRDLTEAAITGMDKRMERLRHSLQSKADAIGLPVAVTGEGSVAGIAFLTDPVRHEDDPSALGLSVLFQLACFNNGVSVAPGGVMALATMVDDDSLSFAIGAMEDALEHVADLG